ncbi:GPI mannosyltransferase [Penicillium sp. DV-2018c]|nr:GPI mannosyltransferase [Penicillium sp. DV-2018c]
MSTPNSPRRVAPQYPSPTRTVLLYLIGFRLVNAFVVRTFFQPDEYFQSLEPAWATAFGQDQGAWVTWEWRHQLRSSLHPLFFAAIYKAAYFLASALNVSPTARAEILIAAPKIAQAVVAALGDFYTWKLAIRVYGNDSRGSWATLAATVLNPWQWFCSTRTLSNCAETTITIAALELWPWKWAVGSTTAASRDKNTGSQKKGTDPDRKVTSRLRRCLPLAALACILRPTNILIWITLASFAWLRTSWAQRRVLISEVAICGSADLAVSSIADRLFYGVWTFPPLRFLYFNIAQSLAVFYGSNDWHYYITQGYPLLLTTLLPFAVWGLYRTLTTQSPVGDRVKVAIRVQLATVCLLMPLVLSFISHKEVRFIYPLLPALHILAAPPLVQYFYPVFNPLAYPRQTPRRLILIFAVLVNIFIAVYTTVYHASGPLSVLSYLRQQHNAHSMPANQARNTATETGISAGFLMPCHSTPWRSHLVYPSINAWALSCEPPIDRNATQKATYRDEADQFYDDPAQFLHQNMAGGLRHLPRRPSYSTSAYSRLAKPLNQPPNPNQPAQHEWPDYLIFFAQLEPTLRPFLRGSSYGECWRTHNTAWHDDWRRRGDIVVWCLDPAEQEAWRSETHRRLQQSRDRQFDRIVESFKKEAHAHVPATPGWKSLVPAMPWSSTPSVSTLQSWQRSVQSLFAPAPKSSTYWPWRRRSRWEKFMAMLSPRKTSWVPSWVGDWLPGWLQGRKRRPTEAELWS